MSSRRASACALAVVACLATPGAATAAQERCEVNRQSNVSVPMRDGTILKADVYRPETDRPVPVLLTRTPYDKDVASTNPGSTWRPELYAERCYLVVTQDVRGQYKSRGTFYAFRDEARDGYDTVEWAARLEGSNGKVGMFGGSYVGATQWLAATQTPPSLKTIVPRVTSSDYWDGWTYQDGALSQAFIQSWPTGSLARSAAEHRGDWALSDELEAASARMNELYWQLPLKAYAPFHPGDPDVAPYYFDWLEHSSNDEYWQEISIRRQYENVDVPVLHVDGWYDVFLNGALENFNGMRERGGSELARENQRIVLGPWDHVSRWARDQTLGEMNYGPRARKELNELQLSWFDHWLKGKDNGAESKPAVRYFLMGANRWKSASAWPIPGTEVTGYYLQSDGRLGRSPEEESEPDRYTYDPRDPVPSRGGHSCCSRTATPMGPFDQREVEQRDDVLVYSTPPLKRSMEVTGPITVTLYASSSARDTDFTAKLVDVHPDGKAINLNDGIIRARFRNSEEKEELLTPGKVERYRIEVWPTSNLFKRGHRIRLEISSSNFPMYDRNPNTGAPLGESAELRTADQTILHDADHPSRVTLPIVPRGE